MRNQQNNPDRSRLNALVLLVLAVAALFGCARPEETRDDGAGGISAALTNKESGPAQGASSPVAPGGRGPPGSGSGAVVP